MKKFGSKTSGESLSLKKSLARTVSKWPNSVKRDFSFYNEYTELLAVWTLLFMSITGLFVFAIRSSFIIMLLSLILAFAIMLIGTFSSIGYLYTLKYQNRKSAFTKIHNLLNKSFKLRNLFRFIRLPCFSIPNIAKNFKLAS
jgi:hypothetical protein